MEILLKFEKENLERIKNLILKDEVISKASITFKNAESLSMGLRTC